MWEQAGDNLLEVREFSEALLDPRLFEVPADFHRVVRPCLESHSPGSTSSSTIGRKLRIGSTICRDSACTQRLDLGICVPLETRKLCRVVLILLVWNEKRTVSEALEQAAQKLEAKVKRADEYIETNMFQRPGGTKRRCCAGSPRN